MSKEEKGFVVVTRESFIVKSWHIKMKTLFNSQDVWDLVESGFPEPTNQQKVIFGYVNMGFS